MSENLYQQALKALALAAHGAGALDPAEAQALRDNPLCGDRVRVSLRLGDGRILTLGQETKGCLLCRASASLLGLRAPGHTRAEIAAAAEALRRLLQEDGETPEAWPEFSLFLPARSYPSRHGCVLLPLETLLAALPG